MLLQYHGPSDHFVASPEPGAVSFVAGGAPVEVADEQARRLLALPGHRFAVLDADAPAPAAPESAPAAAPAAPAAPAASAASVTPSGFGLAARSTASEVE